MTVQHKVLAYITRGTRLLVFSQPLTPDAGIQVPGGTLDEDEDPASGVLREAHEESGLTALRLDAYLGKQVVHLAARDLTLHRHVYHLICDDPAPERWQHFETDPSESPYQPIPFDFYWIDLRGELPSLIGLQGEMLPALLSHLGLRD